VTAASNDLIVLGRISGLFGVKGSVRVYSFTDPRDGVLHYNTWLVKRDDGWQKMTLAGGHRHGKGVIASLVGVEDREQARQLVGCDIALPRDRLPALPEGEYYWTDLEGLDVFTTEGVSLGKVSHLVETGANDVLVVRGDRERMIPMVLDRFVTKVDLSAGRIEVDWDPDF